MPYSMDINRVREGARLVVWTRITQLGIERVTGMVRGGILLNVVGVVLITIFTVLLGPLAFDMVF